MSATYRADSIVIGAGLAGLVTALELIERGQSVVLLDRADVPKLGGLARVSFGGIFIVGSPEQRRAGIKDSVDLALSDWLECGELDASDTWPRRWAEAYVAGSREYVYDWLRGHGVRFFPIVHWVERGRQRRGNPVPRFHMVWGTGQGLVEQLLRALESHPNRDRLLILHRHLVTDLVSDQGRFSGCSGTIEPRGTRGSAINEGRRVFEAFADSVVVASGGIMGNLDLVRRHWPADWGVAPEQLLNGSQPEADGRLHAAAEAHGARLTHLDRMWLYAAGVRHGKPTHEHHGLSLVPPKSALWVDAGGARLGPPPLVACYDTRYLVETVARQPQPYSWQIFNQRIARRELAVSGSEFNHAMRERRPVRFVLETLLGNRRLVADLVQHCPDFVSAGSLEDLVERMNALTGAAHVSLQRLRHEVERFDAEMRRKEKSADEQVKLIALARRYRGDRVRTCKFACLDDPRARPLIAVRETIVTRKSLGGIQTDLDCRVLDASGASMPGLYAVGEAAGFGGGGIHGLRSLEGTFLGGCVFGGRLAAAAITRG